MADMRLSRKIVNLEYNPETQVLVIMFRGGIVKKYKDIPDSIYQELSTNGDPNMYYEEKIIGQFQVY